MRVASALQRRTTMHTTYRTTPIPGSSYAGTAATWGLALVAAVGLAACETKDEPGTPSGAESPVVADRGDEPSTPATQPSTPPGENDEEELAHRMGAPDPNRPGAAEEPGMAGEPGMEGEPGMAGEPGMEGEPGMRTPPDTGAVGAAPTTPSTGEGSMKEMTASGDIQRFEQRLEQELGADDFTLAAAIDIGTDPQQEMRMFVVAPKPEAIEKLAPPSDPSAQGGPTEGMGEQPPPGEVGQIGEQPGGQAGAQPGGEQPAGQAGAEEPSKRAQMALEQARVVVAYVEPNQPELVHIAYIPPTKDDAGQPSMGTPQSDQKVDDAIGRAANGGGTTPTPPTGQQPTQMPGQGETEGAMPPDERRG